MKSPPTNVAHSVRTRLLTIAKAEGEEFNYVLNRCALERFLVRLLDHLGELRRAKLCACPGAGSVRSVSGRR